MTPYVLGNVVTIDLADTLGFANGVVDGRRAQPFEEVHKTVDIARRLFVISAAQADEPTFALQRKQHGATAGLGRLRHMEDAPPTFRLGRRRLEQGAGVAD